MKLISKIGIIAILSGMMTLASCGGSSNSSSFSGFSYSGPTSSDDSALDAVNLAPSTDLGDWLTAICGDSDTTITDKDEIFNALDGLHLNDLYANKCAFDLRNLNYYDYDKDGLASTFASGNSFFEHKGTITRNDSEKTASGTVSIDQKDYDETAIDHVVSISTTGTYALAPDEGGRTFTETYDYLDDSFDSKKTSYLTVSTYENALDQTQGASFAKTFKEMYGKISEGETLMSAPTIEMAYVVDTSVAIRLASNGAAGGIDYRLDLSVDVDLSIDYPMVTSLLEHYTEKDGSDILLETYVDKSFSVVA